MKWAKGEAIWNVICGQAASDFDPNLELFKCEVLYLPHTIKIWREEPDAGDDLRDWTYIDKCLLYATKVKETPNNITILNQMLENFDQNASQLIGSAKYEKNNI
jgi:hypothetical protein